MAGFRILRKQLDDLGYYQPLVVDSIPLVEALLHDLLATTSSLKACRENNEAKTQISSHIVTKDDHAVSATKPSASSTPIIPPSPTELNTKTIRLQSRVKDLENLNRECNSIIRRQQIELEEKSRKILKLELTKGNSSAKVITHNDRPLILSDNLKPRMEMTRLIDGKENAKNPKKSSVNGKESQLQSEIDLVKIYENRNKHLDMELVRLQSELDKAKTLLVQAEKQWQLNFSNDRQKLINEPVVDNKELHTQGMACPKSNYMIKLLNDNNRMKAKLAEIEKHSKTCFHGKVIPVNYSVPPCCCGHIKSCRGECEPVRQCCKQLNSETGPPYSENTRSMVEASHKLLRQSVCIKSRPNKLSQNYKCHTGKENEIANDTLNEEAYSTQDELRNLQGTNRELRRQIKELSQQKIDLKQKLDHTEKQLDILLSNTTKNEKIDHSKIQELIMYIESQRDVYRNSVEHLLNKLDPNRLSNMAHEVENTTGAYSAENHLPVKRPSKVILKNNPNHLRKYPSNKSYCQSIEKSSQSYTNECAPLAEKCQDKDSEILELPSNIPHSPRDNEVEVDQKTKENVDNILDEILRGNNNSTAISNKLEKANERIAHLETEINQLTTKLNEMERQPVNDVISQEHKTEYFEENSKLHKEISSLQHQVEEFKLRDSLQLQRNKQYISDIRDSTDTTIEGLQRDIRAFQIEVKKLKNQIEIKESHLYGISREKDTLQNQLDEKTTQLEDLKSKFRQEKSQMDKLESFNSNQGQRVQQCLSEISTLQNRLRETTTELETVKSRLEAEKSLNRENRQENMKLKDDLYKISTDSEGKDEQIKDLRSNIQTYVTEVKRIEDLLTSREHERGELLEQYKYLSDEVDKSELQRRQLESQITNLKLDLSTRSAELRATESRLADMEQDLIELSLANESYRSQILTLRQEITKLTTLIEEDKSSIDEQKRELRKTLEENDKDRN